MALAPKRGILIGFEVNNLRDMVRKQLQINNLLNARLAYHSPSVSGRNILFFAEVDSDQLSKLAQAGEVRV